jgi:ABC-type Fe3+-hydroxamate transport system substrate-binding protein
MEFLDGTSRTISLPAVPRRIVCLVPGITETLFALGLGGAIVGVTDYCTHPPEGVARVTKVGGTKDPRVDKITQLAPDLVIVNDEENRREDFVALTERGLPVYVTAPRTVADGIAMIERLGPVLGCQTASDEMAGQLRAAYDQVVAAAAVLPRLRAFCPIRRKPWMTFNADTYADDMLWCCGAENVVRAKSDRYFPVTIEEIAALEPELVLLPGEPYPFSSKHVVHLKPLADTPAGRGGHFYCIDGTALCWYGPRIADALTELSRRCAYVRATMDF